MNRTSKPIQFKNTPTKNTQQITFTSAQLQILFQEWKSQESNNSLSKEVSQVFTELQKYINTPELSIRENQKDASIDGTWVEATHLHEFNKTRK